MRQKILLTLIWMLVWSGGFARAGELGAPAEYLGGTLESLAVGSAGSIRTTDPVSLVFQTRKSAVRIPYERINLVEYGLKVDRRLAEAIILSPLMILSKKRAHYVSVGFENDDGKQQALLFRVDKNGIRALLVSLEARTGQKVTFMDEEARKAGKG
jgi:hypothetical protein